MSGNITKIKSGNTSTNYVITREEINQMISDYQYKYTFKGRDYKVYIDKMEERELKIALKKLNPNSVQRTSQLLKRVFETQLAFILSENQVETDYWVTKNVELFKRVEKTCKLLLPDYVSTQSIEERSQSRIRAFKRLINNK